MPATEDGVPLASWGWRAAAYIVDNFLLAAATQLVAAVTPLGSALRQIENEVRAYFVEVLTTGAEMDTTRLMEIVDRPAVTILSLVSIGLFIVYSGVMLSTRGATLGKMLFRLRVVPMGEGRSKPGLAPAKAWLRPAVTQALGYFWLIGLVDMLFPLWDRKRQALHDKLIVGTQVIREERRKA